MATFSELAIVYVDSIYPHPHDADRADRLMELVPEALEHGLVTVDSMLAVIAKFRGITRDDAWGEVYPRVRGRNEPGSNRRGHREK